MTNFIPFVCFLFTQFCLSQIHSTIYQLKCLASREWFPRVTAYTKIHCLWPTNSLITFFGSTWIHFQCRSIPFIQFYGVSINSTVTWPILHMPLPLPRLCWMVSP
jgi:hypothetical protein